MVSQEKLDLARMKSFQGCLFHTGLRKGKLWTDDDDRPQQVVDSPREDGLGTHPQPERKSKSVSLDMGRVGHKHTKSSRSCRWKGR
jgi:hypothetical protein